mgnify:CR=1 FL=1
MLGLEEVTRHLGLRLNWKKTRVIPLADFYRWLKTKFIITSQGKVVFEDEPSFHQAHSAQAPLLPSGRVYLLTALRGIWRGNQGKAARYCRFAVDAGYIPIAPHLYFPRFMDDANPRERDLALFMDIVLLTKCAELWVFGDTVSKGMGIEIEKARRKGQPIRYFTENCQEVSV